jgi:hypothetical protein
MYPVAFIAIVILVLWMDAFAWITQVPVWILGSVGSSILFIPFLWNRAKDDARLVVAVHGGGKLTEYRVGKRYRWNIEGEPLIFTSKSGTQRLIVSDFDPFTGKAVGTQLAGLTQFDQAINLTTFDKLSKEFATHLRSERITKESIGIEVEKQVSSLSDRWLNILYGSLQPTEVEDALNLNHELSDFELEVDESEVIME